MPATISKAGNAAVVLVVDDEAMVRTFAVAVVEDAGFVVLEATNADEAIHILESRDDIRILITDIDMPAGSMNGLRLAAAVRDRWPPIKIIIVSGHYKAGQADLPDGAVFFSKPYLPEALSAQVARFALGAGS